MHVLFAALAAIALATLSAPTPGSIAVGDSAHKILIVVNTTTLSAWTFDPVSRKVVTVEVPATGAQPKPVAGVRIIVKRVCPASAPCDTSYTLTPNGSGSASLPSTMTVGAYAIAVTIPANAIATKPHVITKGATLTFPMAVGRQGAATDKNVIPHVSP